MMTRVALTGVAVAASMTIAVAASAQQAVTVKSLLAQDFTIVSTVMSPAGPGAFLKKADKLFLCFVTETPQSAAVTTKYCKPVE